MISRVTMEIVTATATLATGAVGVVGGIELGSGWSDHGPEPGYFPFWVGLILIGASLCNAVSAVWRYRGDGNVAFLDREQAGRIASFLGPMFVFVLLTVTMGTYLASTVYLAFIAWMQGKMHPFRAVALGIAFSVVLYVIFEMLFLVRLHKGPIEAALGIY